MHFNFPTFARLARHLWRQRASFLCLLFLVLPEAAQAGALSFLHLLSPRRSWSLSPWHFKHDALFSLAIGKTNPLCTPNEKNAGTTG